MKIRVGTLVTVKVGEIDEKIREVESISMKKYQAYNLKLPCNSIYLLLSYFLMINKGLYYNCQELHVHKICIARL